MSKHEISFDQAIADQAVGQFHQRILQPRKLGTNDCCLAVAEVLQLVWGVDLMDGIRGAYDSQKSMRRVIRHALGADGFADAMDKVVTKAGARRLDDQQMPKPQEFDLAIGLIDLGKGIECLPAFYWQGYWMAMTNSGFATLEVITTIYRFEPEGN